MQGSLTPSTTVVQAEPKSKRKAKDRPDSNRAGNLRGLETSPTSASNDKGNKGSTPVAKAKPDPDDLNSTDPESEYTTEDDSSVDDSEYGNDSADKLMKSKGEMYPFQLRDELRCLVRFLDNDLQDVFETLRQIENLTIHTITFPYLWFLFRPGDTILTRSSPTLAFRVLHVSGGRQVLGSNAPFPGESQYERDQRISHSQEEGEELLYSQPIYTPLVIDCFNIDFDGVKYGPTPRRFMMEYFPGEVKITDLKVYPAVFHDNWPQTEKALAQRGKRFTKLANGAHRRYSGLTCTDAKLELWYDRSQRGNPYRNVIRTPRLSPQEVSGFMILSCCGRGF